MDQDQFWEIIDEARKIAGSGRESHEALEEILSEQTPEWISEFETEFQKRMYEAYHYSLWGAAYLIGGGCSDDSFMDFRGWLIAQGKETFRRAIDDPDSLADLPRNSDFFYEEFLYAAYNAYENMTGEMIELNAPAHEPDPGEMWDFDDENEMKKRYPKLFEKYWDDPLPT
jgi:hypothetical protein